MKIKIIVEKNIGCLTYVCCKSYCYALFVVMEIATPYLAVTKMHGTSLDKNIDN